VVFGRQVGLFPSTVATVVGASAAGVGAVAAACTATSPRPHLCDALRRAASSDIVLTNVGTWTLSRTHNYRIALFPSLFFSHFVMAHSNASLSL